MFTGIIRQKGRVVSIERGEVMLYALHFPHEDLEIGASVSVDGVCQTVVAIDEDLVFFQAIDETLRCTTLGALTVGSAVNVERSVRIGDEIGGHLLSGHVTTVATIATISHSVYTFSLPHTRYLFPKGFVAVDGMSLTVVDVLAGPPHTFPDNTQTLTPHDQFQASERRFTSKKCEKCGLAGGFTVHLIPETLKWFRKAEGDRVNIGFDALTVATVETIFRFFS